MQKIVVRSMFILVLLLGIVNAVFAQDSIKVGDTVTAQATGEDILYTISLESGQVITIDLSSIDFDTLIRVLNANGEELARNDDKGGNGTDWSNSLLTYEAPESGEYTLVVTTGFGIANGEYTLNIESGTIPTTSENADGQSSTECGTSTASNTENDSKQNPDLHIGDSITDDIDGRVTYRISLNADQTVIINLSSDDFDSYLELRDNRGRNIASDDDSGGNLNSRLVFTADEAGDYTLLVRALSGDAFGTYSLSMVENCASTDVGSIEYGQTIHLTPNGAFNQIMTFEGTAGDVINLYAVSSTYEDTVIVLNDPSGNEIVRDDDGGSSTNPAVRRFILPATGTYEVDLQSFNSSQMFDPIDVTLERSELLTLSAEPTEVTMGGDLTNEVMVFDAVRGTRYLLIAEFGNDIPKSLSMNLLQSNETYAQTTFSIAGTSSFAAIFQADATGTVQVQLEYYGYSGSVTFTIALEPKG